MPPIDTSNVPPHTQPEAVPDGAPSGFRLAQSSADDLPAARPTLSILFERLFGSAGSENEFLPAALEVIETPASPLERTVALALAAFFTIAVIWAIVGEIDVVAVAQGRIVPAGGVQVIQSLEIGAVRAIHVRDGQHVAAGDLLIELDPTESEVDRDQLTRERLATSLDLARLTAILRVLDGATAELTLASGATDSADPVLVRMQRERMTSDLFAHDANLAALDGELARRTAEREAIKAEIEKFEATIPLIAERVEAYGTLLKKGIARRPEWLALRQELIGQQQDLAVQKHRLVEAAQAMTTVVRQRYVAEAEFRRDVLADMVAVRDRVDAAELALRTAERRERQHRLTAPVAGIVQQLAVHTVGGVVTPAEPLMVLVPRAAPLEIETMVLNKDRGFVRAGQSAEIKVESFPFTRYGLIGGTVKHVSGDAILDDILGPVYAVRVEMAQTTVRADGRQVPLAPGMNVTVEIKTGKRQIIEFLMSPLLRYRQESLRER